MGAPAASAADPASVRFAHLSPDSPAIDVALAPASADGPLTDPGPDVAADLAYGRLTPYRTLAPGSYAVSVRAAGAPADTPPALSTRIDVAAGTATTVTLVGLFDDLALAPLSDDLSAPPEGTARVRVLAAATAAGAMTMTAAGEPVETPPFPGAGRYDVVPAGPAEVRLEGREPLAVDLAAGSVVTVLVLDADGGVAVRPVVDAAGAAVVPAGGVDAGTGPPAVPVGALAIVGLAFLRRTRVPLLVVAATATVLAGVATAPPAVAGPSTVAVTAAHEVPAPVRVRAPGIDAAVAPVALDASGTLAAPGDPAVAGWYADGPAPGGTGPAVLAAHVDWAGAAGAFAGVRHLRAGDEVAVERADGSTVRFTVTRVVRAPKDAFPAADVYGPTPDAELRLITCGGRFDRTSGSYEDNVVVFARQMS